MLVLQYARGFGGCGMSEEKLERAMREVLGDVFTALAERGYAPSDMASMSPETRFDEYCGYHLGDKRWGEDLRATWKLVNFDADYPPP